MCDIKEAAARQQRLKDGESEESIYALVEPLYFANITKRKIDRAMLADAMMELLPIAEEMAAALREVNQDILVHDWIGEKLDAALAKYKALKGE